MSDRNCPECIWHNGRHCTSFNCEYMSYSDAKKRLQSAQPERERGKWIDDGFQEEWWGEQFTCSICDGTMIGMSIFCPFCGAVMEGE